MYMDQSNHPVSNPLPIRTMQKSSELNSHSSNGRGGAHPNTSGGHSRSSADQYQFRSNDDNDNCKHQLFVLYIYNYIILLLLLLFLFFDYDYSDDKEKQSTVHTINYYLPRPTCCSMHHSSFHSIPFTRPPPPPPPFELAREREREEECDTTEGLSLCVHVTVCQVNGGGGGGGGGGDGEKKHENRFGRSCCFLFLSYLSMVLWYSHKFFHFPFLFSFSFRFPTFSVYRLIGRASFLALLCSWTLIVTSNFISQPPLSRTKPTTRVSRSPTFNRNWLWIIIFIIFIVFRNLPTFRSGSHWLKRRLVLTEN